MMDFPGPPDALDERSGEIFRRIVETYLSTGEPAGSRNVSRMLSMALSPASVRNVMADLEAMGLIYAPHTSAGRMPTESGLRFFVDAFLEVGDLSAPEREAIERQMRGEDGSKPVEALLTEASQMLSGLSRGAGLVLAGKRDARLKHVEFVRIEPERALVVLVDEDGAVENRIVEVPADMPSAALVEATNYLNAQAHGRRLAEARTTLEHLQDERRREVSALAERLIEAGLAAWGGEGSAKASPGTLIVRGRSNLIGDDLADVERLRHLFDDLEARAGIIEFLSAVEAGEGVRIFIGSENKLFSLSGSSLVVAPFRNEEEGVVGALGIIGPTRLNYARVVPMVDYTAQLVSRLVSAKG